MIWAVREYSETDPLILSVSENQEVSIKDVAEYITKAFKFDGELIFNSNLADGQFKKTACNSKLMKYLPDFKFTPIEIAIQETVNWFVENYDNCRK